MPNPLTLRRSTRTDHLRPAVEGAQAGEDRLARGGVVRLQQPGDEPASHRRLVRERVQVVGGDGAVDDRKLGQPGRAALGQAGGVDLAARLDLAREHDPQRCARLGGGRSAEDRLDLGRPAAPATDTVRST